VLRIIGLGTFKEEILNHLVDIKTGEGKSITLAITAATLALLKFDVYVACYSQYLTDRDYRQFKEFFAALGIENNINYGTFNTLAEKVINKEGDLRDIVNNVVTNKKPTILKNKKEDC
jgi:preprotein translocase subunit SecA